MNKSQYLTYNPISLSDEEKKRFITALGDGFGYSHRSEDLDEEKLPSEVNSGLLDHRAYYDKHDRSELYDEGDEGEFWEGSDGDSPPGLFEQCPLNFHMPSIREYFSKQKKIYLNYLRSTERHNWLSDLKTEDQENWEYQIYSEALYETYSKVWYEFHINQKIYYCDETVASLCRLVEKGSPLGFCTMLLTKFSAQLGRLIEQYYWKFLIEKSAMRGRKIIDSAKSGGEILASIRRAEHSRWQSAAILIWNERPTIPKMAVATILKKRFGFAQSAKHIARVLKHP